MLPSTMHTELVCACCPSLCRRVHDNGGLCGALNVATSSSNNTSINNTALGTPCRTPDSPPPPQLAFTSHRRLLGALPCPALAYASDKHDACMMHRA
jgi:hypothetical protein